MQRKLRFVVVLIFVLLFATGMRTHAKTFDEMLEQLRGEFSEPRLGASNVLETIFVGGDDDDYGHIEPLYDEHELILCDSPDDIIYAANIQDYIEGSTRDFIRVNERSNIPTEGILIKQGQHVNIWMLTTPIDANCVPISEILAANVLDGLIEEWDTIFEHMTEDFAPFKGVRVRTNFANMPEVGDVNRDGRINVLLYNMISGGGFFSFGDYLTDHGNIPIAMVHMDMRRAHGFNNLMNNRLAYNSLFAHEIQHLFWYTYLGVFAQTRLEFSWINEGLSDFAAKYYTVRGTEYINVPRIARSLENSYANPADSREGDFVNFNGSQKNYSIGNLYTFFKHQKMGNAYIASIYDYFRTFLPTSTTPEEFVANRAKIPAGSMREVLGNAFINAGLMGDLDVDGATAFDLLYFLFMESFAADGGQVFGDTGATQTQKFFANNLSAFNMWGIRLGLGMPSETSPFLGRIFTEWLDNNTARFTNIESRTPLPVLNSGENVSLNGYNLGTIPLGATHEMMYRLSGETAANPVIRISVPDSDSRTQYYIAVLKEPIETAQYMQRGQHGADIFPLRKNGIANYVNTHGRPAYLFVATIYRNVNNVSVSYTWTNSIGVPVPPTSPEIRLREAVSQISTSPTVVYLDEDMTLSEFQQPLVIPRGAKIILRSAGGVTRTLTASGDFDVIHVLIGAELTIDGVDIKRAPDTIGRGITNLGTLTLIDGVISGHSVPNEDGGGVLNRGSFIMNGGIIDNNRANNGGGVRTTGVASYFEMKNGVISNSTATGNGGGVCVGPGVMVLNGGEISDNSATLGGGVCVLGGSSFTMNDGEISDNSSTGNNGGGVFNEGRFIMTGGKIDNNRTTNNGGGVRNVGVGYFRMENGEISNNTATGSGGGVDNSGTMTIGIGKICGNRANSTGGGILNRSGAFITMTDGEINENTSTGNGGGVQNEGRFIMEDGSIDNNNSDSTGGGVRTSGATASFEMKKGTISNNTARVTGGGASVANLGTMIMEYGKISGNNTVTNAGGGVIVATGSSFTIKDGEISKNTSFASGGGVFNEGNFVMTDGSIDNNNGSSGGGVRTTGAAANVRMEGGKISNNTSTGEAGGVSVGNGVFEMKGGEISNNTAQANGGGMMNYARFVMEGGKIDNNIANNGGGIRNSGAAASFRMENGVISNNTARSDGGGVSLAGGNMIMENGKISGNNAARAGGIAVGTGLSLTMNGGEISGHSVTGNGGGLFVWGLFTMNGGKISDNTASGGGGIGINVADYANLRIGANAVFDNNTASTARNRATANDTVYATNIAATQWTDPFSQGFNNYDITSTGTTVTLRQINFILGGAESIAPILYVLGTNIFDAPRFPNNPVWAGYIFDRWDTSSDTSQNFTLSANWLRLGAITTGGNGNITSADITHLARYVANHTGFEIEDYRIANLRGDNRKPELSDVTMFARWLVGYDLADLISQISQQ
jgi:hypothetical protein